MARYGCSDCERYKKSGENYCRMCGFHFTAGYVQNTRNASIYHVSEKFCGHCGAKKDDCACR